VIDCKVRAPGKISEQNPPIWLSLHIAIFTIIEHKQATLHHHTRPLPYIIISTHHHIPWHTSIKHCISPQHITTTHDQQHTLAHNTTYAVVHHHVIINQIVLHTTIHHHILTYATSHCQTLAHTWPTADYHIETHTATHCHTAPHIATHRRTLSHTVLISNLVNDATAAVPHFGLYRWHAFVVSWGFWDWYTKITSH